ncbi:MAG: tyrosine-type recombinase/integrase, partial [Pseudomonadota bacterium]
MTETPRSPHGPRAPHADDRARIDAYLSARSAEGAAATTLSAYGRELALISAELPSGLMAADADALLALSASWAERLAPRSQARRRSTLRGFYGFARLEGWRGDDPTTRLRAPTPPKALPKPLSRDDIERITSATWRLPPPAGARARCLLELLYGAGLRVSEAAGLPLAAVTGALRGGRATPPLGDHPPIFLQVTGKGGRERLVPLSDDAIAALEAWIAIRSEGPGAAGPHLFPSPRAGGAALSREAVFQLIKRLSAIAGVPPERAHPHAFRHAFAT